MIKYQNIDNTNTIKIAENVTPPNPPSFKGKIRSISGI
jgi:hypothetical protein